MKPIWGADGAVTMIHAGETMNGVTAIGGKSFSLRAARERNRIAEQHYNSTLNTFAGRAMPPAATGGDLVPPSA
jgi:hypothetical protein